MTENGQWQTTENDTQWLMTYIGNTTQWALKQRAMTDNRE